MSNYLKEALTKWADVLDDESSGKLSQKQREVTAIVMENTSIEQAKVGRVSLDEALPGNSTGNVSNFDPVVIGLLRRTMPKLIAYDFCSVQPMTLPTGLVFAARSRYTSATGAEAQFNEADTGFSAGAAAQAGTNPVDATVGLAPWDPTPGFTTTGAVSTAAGEDFGGATTMNEMAFTIEKYTVTAGTRGLKAGYTDELQQDLKSVHGLDAEAELSTMLTNEVVAEMNREIVRTVYKSAYVGAQGTTVPGTFDLNVDSNGRWSVERFKGLMFQIEREANRIANTTRLGRGNIILCSSDVASALAMTGKLDVSGIGTKELLDVDDTGNTFVGILNGRYKVYIDPYLANGDNNQFCVVGYKGNKLGEAGMFYCPYVPLYVTKLRDPQTSQPRLFVKSRYALVGNPLNAANALAPAPAFGLASQSNAFFRLFKVSNVH